MERKLVSMKERAGNGYWKSLFTMCHFKFKATKTRRTVLSQLSYEQLCWTSHEETNSIAIIIKHLHGNMRSRWTDFLTSDGEKIDRNRDGEFEGGYNSKEEVLVHGGKDGGMFLKRCNTLTRRDILKISIIFGVKNTLLCKRLKGRFLIMLSHIGQIIYIGKMLKEKEWECLSIPKGQSNRYLQK